MYSLNWPDMFSTTYTKVIQDHEATMSNLKLILLSDKYSLLGDPYFGTNLKKLMFNQNNQVLRDIVIDDIYTAILTFMPQLVVNRKDITVTSNGVNIYVAIRALNLLDYTTDLYNINLTQSEEI